MKVAFRLSMVFYATSAIYIPSPAARSLINACPSECLQAWTPTPMPSFTTSTIIPSQTSNPRPSESLPPITTSKNAIVAYWADWTNSRLPYTSIPWNLITHLNYAFAILRSDYSIHFDTDYILTPLVKLAHQNNVKVLLSVGGWTGSVYFSPMAKSAASRATFIQNCMNLITTYGLDGIDIDWEYPGRLGDTCNQWDKQSDTNNFLQLLKELRLAVGSTREISLAVRVQPFDGPNGPLQDVSAFSQHVNRFNIMAYDISGAGWSSATGPNAPLKGDLSVEQAWRDWTAAGIPASQISMGCAFYGRAFTLTDGNSPSSNGISNSFVTGQVPPGDSTDALWQDPCGGPAIYSGVWRFNNLVSQGILSGPNYDQVAPGWTRKVDSISQTPYIWNSGTKQFISYDDPVSLRAKVDYVKAQGAGGIMFWELSQVQ